MEPEFHHDVLFSNRLQETGGFVPGTDAQVIKDTFRVYGSAFAVMLFVFCVMRKRNPRLYNVRRWAPKIRCELAQQEYGFISWIWMVYGPSDDNILDQCGMDALCFLRIIRFGLQISCLGILNSFWLLPMYATATSSSETASVKDPVEEMTTSNLPSMSPRFVGTVVGSYIMFLYTIYLLFREFEWYTKHRHAFLAKRTPRNYAIYVSGIPKEYQSSELLLEYFQSCFPMRSVLEAHVAVDIPNLTNLVSTRDTILANLEHALAVKQIYGYSPTHLTLQGKVGSISAYRKELRCFNATISGAIGRIRMKSEASYANMRLKLMQNMSMSHFVDYPPSLDSTDHNQMQAQSEERYPLSPRSDRRVLNHDSVHCSQLLSLPENKTFDPYTTLRTNKRGFRDRLSIFFLPEDVAFRDLDASHSDEETGSLRDELMDTVPLSSIFLDKDCNKGSVDDGLGRIELVEVNNEEVTSHDGIGRSFRICQDCEANQVVPCHQEESLPDGDRKAPILEDFAPVLCDDDKTAEQVAPDVSHQESLDVVSLCSSERFITTPGSSGSRSINGLVKPGKLVKVLTGSSTETIAREVGNAFKEVNVDSLKSATDKGIRKLKKTGMNGFKQVSSAGTLAFSEVVLTAKDLIIGNEDGSPRDAGFVVFTTLSTTHAALQMIHHDKPYMMDVKEAPEPHDIFWNNVGKSQKSRRLGQLLSLLLSAVLCFFWTIPVSIISGFSEIESLKESIPFLAALVEKYPRLENALSLIAPLLLIGLNSLLPSILREFAKAEGHIASSTLEASVFVKLSAFMIIQTFFVSAISGGVYAQLTEILKDPGALVDLLGNSLPTQGTYFVQIVLVTTFFGQGMELLRVSPLVIAFLRTKIGPNLTEKERNRPFRIFLRPLSDPTEFQHAQVFASVVLYFMVIFVYAVISPIINYIMAFCFLIMGSAYRYQFISNYPSTPDSGGKLWFGFITICLSCMLIAQITLLGLLALKKANYALPCMAPLMAITVYFTHFLRQKHSYVTMHLPTRDCLRLDRTNFAVGNNNFGFVKSRYMQPPLLAQDENPCIDLS